MRWIVLALVTVFSSNAFAAAKPTPAQELLSWDEDDMRGITWYSSPEASETFHLYFGVARTKVLPLRLAATYSDSDWVFAQRLLIKVDGKVFTVSPPRGAWNRDVRSGVSESIDIPLDSTSALARALGRAKSIKIRFDGRYTSDTELSEAEVFAIRKVYWAWRATRTPADADARAGLRAIRDAMRTTEEAAAKEQAEIDAAAEAARADQDKGIGPSPVPQDPPSDPVEDARQERLRECMAAIPYDASEKVEFEESTKCYEEATREQE